MNAWTLPTTITIQGITYNINTDFRQIINILVCFNDPELEQDERYMVAIECFYREPIPPECMQEALEKMCEFIDAGVPKEEGVKPRLMDWEQDAGVIIPSINKVLGYEVRAKDYLHWWTFLGGYMEIGEGLYSNIINIRSKKAHGKKLEKYEQEFLRDNKELCELKSRLTEEEQAEKDALNKLLGG